MLKDAFTATRAIAAVTLVTLVYLFISFTVYRSNDPVTLQLDNTATGGLGTETTLLDIGEARFIASVMDDSHVWTYSHKPLQDLCKSKTWTPGLVLRCDDMWGGPGNLRNWLLNCVRYAIELGAAFELPRFRARGTENIADFFTHGEHTGLEAWYDLAHFKESLKIGCPQLAIVPFTETVNTTYRDVAIQPRELFPATEIFEEEVLTNLSALRPLFDGWLNSTVGLTAPVSLSQPVLLVLARSLFVFRLSDHTTEFVRNFGKICRIRDDIRELAARVLYNLTIEYHLDFKFDTFIQKNSYYGAHLRTEFDAARIGWGNYHDQAPIYIEEARQLNSTVIYVASGDLAACQQLALDASPIPVVTKSDLIPSASFSHLTFDQQALIDWFVLERSSFMGGKSTSTFSVAIAQTRRWFGNSVYENPLNGSHGRTWDDEYSTIVGGHGECRRMFESMWP